MSLIVSIEGNIGSGKSTILNFLKENIKSNIVFLPEPVSEWENIKDKNGVTILEKFYENQEKYSFAFQIMAYISRLSMLKDAIEKNPDAIIITERCLNTDRYVFAKMLYDAGKMEEVEYQIYLNWFDHFNYLQQTQKMIYLKTNPSVCIDRINKRNRTGESNISLTYLENCHKYHEDMIKNVDLNKLLIIDSNVDIYENENINNIWLESIKKLLNRD